MVDGPIEAVDLELTESNRAFVRSYVETVLIDGQLDKLANFVAQKNFIEHNPGLGEVEDESDSRIGYERIHRVLAEGNFVLCVGEGNRRGDHTAFYDLFRLSDGKVVEHWDTTEKIAARSEWKNDNGKF